MLSPDPKDHVSLDVLRELTIAWAREHFGEYEVAIVYHDDNIGRIPHAHVVVNNTNIVTGRHLQDPDPKELKHSLQRMAADRGLSDFDTRARAAPHTAGRARAPGGTRDRREERLLLGGGHPRPHPRCALCHEERGRVQGAPQEHGRGGRGQLRQGAPPRLGVLAYKPPPMARLG